MSLSRNVCLLKSFIFDNFNYGYCLLYRNFIGLTFVNCVFSRWIWRSVSSVDSGKVWIFSNWFSTEEVASVFSTAIQSQILIITGKISFDFYSSWAFVTGFIFPLWFLVLSFSLHSYLLIWNSFYYYFMHDFKTWIVLNF